MQLRNLNNLIRLHVKDQLFGFGYYLILLIPAIVITMIVLSVPEEKYTVIPVFIDDIASRLPLIEEEIRKNQMQPMFLKLNDTEAHLKAESKVNLTLDLMSNGVVGWYQNAPQASDRISILVVRLKSSQEEKALVDAHKYLQIAYPFLPVKYIDLMSRVDRRSYIVGVACLIGTYFISGVVSILVILELFRGIGRLRMVYRPYHLEASAFASAVVLSIAPIAILFGTGFAFGCVWGGIVEMAIIIFFAICSGIFSGMFIALSARCLSNWFNEIVFISFMTVSQGFIILAQYSGIIVSVDGMSPLGKALARALPLHQLVTCFERLSILQVAWSDASLVINLLLIGGTTLILALLCLKLIYRTVI